MNRFLKIALISVAYALSSVRLFAADSSTAELLFQKGRAAMVAQDFKAACQLFSESLQLDPAVGTLMNLAACEQRRGKYATSYKHWQDALVQLEEDDPRRAFASEQAAAVDKRVARLTIELDQSAPKNAAVSWDGVELKKNELGKEFRVDPGAHLIVVQSKTHEEKRYHFPLDPGQKTAMTVTVGAPLPTSSPDVPREKNEAQRIAGYASLGVGAVGVVGMIVTGAMLPAKKKNLDDLCPDKQCSTSEGIKKRDNAQKLLALNTASWVVAGVALAAGTALLLTLPLTKEGPPSGKEKKAGSPKKTHADTRIQLAIYADRLELFGTF